MSSNSRKEYIEMLYKKRGSKTDSRIKIIDKADPTVVTFENVTFFKFLYPSEVFRYQGLIYMKLGGAFSPLDGGSRHNAMLLETGSFTYLDDYTEVYPCDCELIVKG